MVCVSPLSSEQIISVKAVAMDMSAAYVKIAKACIPVAEEKFVHDRFHVMKLSTEAVDKVRRQENRVLVRSGDSSLKSSRYIWITSQENLTDAQRKKFEELNALTLETDKAWAYKEMLRDLWTHDDAQSATTLVHAWYSGVIHTKLGPLKRVARTIKERLATS